MSKTTNLLLVCALGVILIGAGCNPATPRNQTSEEAGDVVSTNTTNCETLKIVADGQDITSEFNRGIAYTAVNSGSRVSTIDLFNHDGIACTDVLPKYRPTAIPAEEVVTRVFLGDYSGVAISSHIELPANPDIKISKEASDVGDTMTICIHKPIEFTATAGKYAGKEVKVSGGFTGEYCGDKTEN